VESLGADNVVGPNVAYSYAEPRLPALVDHMGTPEYCKPTVKVAVPPSGFTTFNVYDPAVFAGAVDAGPSAVETVLVGAGGVDIGPSAGGGGATDLEVSSVSVDVAVTPGAT
jgi:hypothetical protein